MSEINLIHGDCIEEMKKLPDNSVDSIVTDPPYGLGFMNKHWDSLPPGVDVFSEAIRVLKPGGHLLAFGGSRTYHRLAVAIEDSGFEIRDQIMWVYGTGFPKSMDVSKAIDKAAGAERERVGEKLTGGIRRPPKALRGSGKYDETRTHNYSSGQEMVGITAPATEEAKQWDGWGTALKPAHEPIVVARKPLAGTVAANVLEWGTGAINIDGGRVETQENPSSQRRKSKPPVNNVWEDKRSPESYSVERPGESIGRWPANLIHDGSDEVVRLFPESRGQQGDVRGSEPSRTGSESTNCYGKYEGRVPHAKREDSGSAARFFYCAKASRQDRDDGLEEFLEKEAGVKNTSGRGFSETDPMGKVLRKNIHPTVKPTDLMRYLCRLITPPGGVVFDPFMGSGSTGKAAILEGFSFVGIEREEEYVDIAKERVEHAKKLKKEEEKNKQEKLW